MNLHIQRLDKKWWQHLCSSEITLLPEVNTLTFLLSVPPSAKSVKGVLYHQHAAPQLLLLSSSDHPTVQRVSSFVL
jgi:hypothetical protein